MFQRNLILIVLLVNHVILFLIIILLTILLLITYRISPSSAFEICEDQYMVTVNLMLSMVGVLFGRYTQILVGVGGPSFRMFGRIIIAQSITAEHIAPICIHMLDAALNEWVPQFVLSII